MKLRLCYIEQNIGVIYNFTQRSVYAITQYTVPQQPEKNWTLYEEGDFSKCQIPNQWNCVFDKHGDGYRMRFPVKMRTLLVLSPQVM